MLQVAFTLCCNCHNLGEDAAEIVDTSVAASIETHHDATVVHVVADADVAVVVVDAPSSSGVAAVPPFAVVGEGTVDAVVAVDAFEHALTFAVASCVTAVAVVNDASALAALVVDAGGVHGVVGPSFAAPALQRSWPLVQHWERETLADGEVTASNP